MDCRDCRTPSLRVIPLASRYGNVSLSREKLKILPRTTLLLILTIRDTSKISYNRRDYRVGASGRHHLIWMFEVKTVGIIYTACICNGRRGRLIFKQPWRDATKQEGAV